MIPCGAALSIHRQVRSCTILIHTKYTLRLLEGDPDQTAHGLRNLLSTQTQLQLVQTGGNFDQTVQPSAAC